MSVSTATAARSLAFGAIGDGVWGVAWLPSLDASGPVVLGAAGGADVVDAAVEAQGPEGTWRIVGPDADLTLAPTGAILPHHGDRGLEGSDQLCQADGRFALGGSEWRVGCPGWRGTAEPAPGPDGLTSFRQLAAWFETGDGLALLALRPRSGRGQDADLITAAVLDQESSADVSDPRLSTTYGGDGLPRRVGLELWIGDEEDQYLRRAAGEAIGAPATWTVDGLDLHAQLLRWHSSGQEGAGVYVMGKVPSAMGTMP